MPKTTIEITLDSDLLERFDALVKTAGSERDPMVQQAIEEFIEFNAAEIELIRERQDKARAPETEWYSIEDVERSTQDIIDRAMMRNAS